MADVLQEARELGALFAFPLVGDFIANAPHHDAGVVAIVMDEVDEVALYPLVEVLVVAIAYLGGAPLVERLDHEHHAHLITSFDQLGGRHIVGGADGIAAHVFEEADLTADGGIVDRCAEHAEVVVIAHATELGGLAIDEEATVGDDLDGADAEGGGVFIAELLAVVEARDGGVAHGGVDTPELGTGHLEVLVDLCGVELAGGADKLGYGVLLGIEKLGLETDLCGRDAIGDDETGADLNLGAMGIDTRGGDAGAPGGDVKAGGDDEMDIAVEAGTGVPARGFVLVLEADGELVGLAGLEVWGGIDGEGAIAVGPIAGFVAVDVDAGMAHGTIEDEGGLLAGGKAGGLELEAVPAGAYKGESAGTAGMLHGFFLAILGDGDVLTVVMDAEGAVDGPIVGHGDGLPGGIGKLGLTELGMVLTGEAPALFEGLDGAYLGLDKGEGAKGSERKGE